MLAAVLVPALQVEGAEAVSAARPPVPYVARWSGEDRLSELVVIPTPRGIAYADETVQDRDSCGVLWARRPLARGKGRPMLGYVHTQRQRSAMRRLLCQVCGLPADQDTRGVLWLLEDHREEEPDWPEEQVTVHPPVCAEHAALSARACPHLRRTGTVVVRVAHSEIDGVYGMRYRPAGDLAVPAGKVTLPYGDPATAWVLAAHQTRVLYGCTLVEPEPEPDPDEGADDIDVHVMCKECMKLLPQLGRARGAGDRARTREIKDAIRRHPDH